MTRVRVRASALLVACAAVASACGSDGPGRLEFGIRRLSLDLAFVDEDAAPPVEPNIVVRLVPAPAEVLDPDYDFGDLETEPFEPPVLELCPEAPPNATIGVSASPSIIDPPLPGTYLRNNEGWIEIQGATLPIRLPYPFVSAWEISETTEDVRPGPFGTPGAVEPARQFTVTKSLGPEFTVTETYEMAPEALLLLERVTVASGVETRFRTDPPIEFFHFGAEGDEWTSAGADTENGFGVLVQGRIEDRAVIDVCGLLVDTFQIAYTEQVVNLRNGETSGTNETTPSKIYLAPQFGGLVIREDMHTIQRTTSPEDGSPLVIRLDYLSTIGSVKPVENA
jgi:hypothetical protein